MTRLSTRTLLLALGLGLCLAGGAGCYAWDRTWPYDAGADAASDHGPAPDHPLGDAPTHDMPRDTISPDVFKRPGTWVTIPYGTFTMGSTPATDFCRGTNEYLHIVKLTRNFEISTTEVTQAMFLALMKDNPSPTPGDLQFPVNGVSWHRAAAFCNALSLIDGNKTPCYKCTGSGDTTVCSDSPFPGTKIYNCPGYRLPTEAEWEYAYRAGATIKTNYYHKQVGPWTPTPAQCNLCVTVPDVGTIGWYCGNATGKIHPVKEKQANNWKLYDMAGNVWEWCHDWFQDVLPDTSVEDPIGTYNSEAKRVRRGGGYDSEPQYLRAAERDREVPAAKASNTGFRCVRTIP